MHDDLDALLSRPLAEMPDSGFSNRVMGEMELRHLRRERRLTEILIGLVVLAAMLLPFTVAGAGVAAFAFTGAGAALIGLPLAAFVMLFSLKKFSH